jgi:hypothetical protein
MKNSELDRLLKSVPAPDHAEGYWDQFPGRVMARIHWISTHAEGATARSRTRLFPFPTLRRFAAFGFGLVAIGLLLGYALNFWPGRGLSITDSQLATARRYFQEIETLFPNQIQAIVFDHQGPRLVLADQPNVPVSSPLYLSIRGPKGHQDYVTFSGQHIRFNGEQCEVLLDHQGNVLLVGRQWVWSAAQTAAKNARYQIAARLMETAL